LLSGSNFIARLRRANAVSQSPLWTRHWTKNITAFNCPQSRLNH